MKTKTTHIPAGYKPSPLGPIPEDWEVKRLGDFSTFFSGGTPKSGNALYYNGTTPFIRSGEINRDKTELFLSQEGIDNSSAKFVEVGDILYALYGANSGQCSLSKINGVINQAILCIRPEADRYYIMTFLQLNKDHYYNSYLQGGQGNLSGEIVSNYKIAIPPTGEQERICAVLQLWDTAIEKQTALIEKFTLRKRGLMQQLITGKKRLKGFSGEWKEVRFGDVASINRGGSPRPIEQYLTKGEGFNWIKIGDVGVNAKYITSTEEKIIKEGLSKTRFVKSGDFILSNSMSFGRPYILKIEGCIHDGWLVIQEYDKTFNIEFLYYILGYDSTLAQYKSMAAGSGVLNLNKEIVKEVLLKVPSIKEQTAIASILVNADKEIELANKKLARLQEEKRGLMQVLLTGKKRLLI